MTDYLEPYRRMVRSIRFVPALGRQQPSYQSVTSSLPIHSRTLTSAIAPEVTPAPDPLFNHSEHIAALVREAVSKPTVLPVRYTVLENIGDRIGRLAAPKRITPIIIPPKIPQPDPNWTPPASVALQHKLNDVSDTDAVASTVEERVRAETLSPLEQQAEDDRSDIVAVADVVEQGAIAALAAEIEKAREQLEPASELVPNALNNHSDDRQETEATVAPIPISNQEASDKEEETQILQCPKCESTQLWKSGYYKGKQRYACRDCGKKFVLSDSANVQAKQQTKANSDVNTSKVKASQADGDVSANLQKASKGRHNRKAKGFGRRQSE